MTVRRLDDGTTEDIGGKAAGLRRLMELGLPVPPAVIIPASSSGDLDDPDGLIPFLGEPLAVRSSAIGEDAAGRSAAGQFDTVLDVSLAELPQAVRRVLASARSARARAYTGGGDPSMAVVIQRQVRATRAGVAFSRDPVGGGPEILVECVFGRGEPLVSGIVDPDRFWVDPAGEVLARLSVKPESYRLLRTLRDDEVLRVAELTRVAERGFGRPVDVEFCLEGADVWLVQCRPITTISVL